MTHLIFIFLEFLELNPCRGGRANLGKNSNLTTTNKVLNSVFTLVKLFEELMLLKMSSQLTPLNLVAKVLKVFSGNLPLNLTLSL